MLNYVKTILLASLGTIDERWNLDVNNSWKEAHKTNLRGGVSKAPRHVQCYAPGPV